MQWTWFSDVTGCTWISCIRWCERTNFPAPSYMLLDLHMKPPTIILCSQLTSLRQNILERRFARCTSGLISYKKRMTKRVTFAAWKNVIVRQPLTWKQCVPTFLQNYTYVSMVDTDQEKELWWKPSQDRFKVIFENLLLFYTWPLRDTVVPRPFILTNIHTMNESSSGGNPRILRMTDLSRIQS